MYDANARRRERYHEWREQGLCGKCGKRWAEAGHAKCRVCRIAAEKSARANGRPEALKQYKRNMKAERREKGLCINCGQPLKESEIGKNTQCRICRAKQAEREQVARIRKKIQKQQKAVRL